MARRIGVGLAIALAALLFIVLATFALAQTAAGQRMVARALEQALSSPQAPAEVQGLHGTLPFDITLDRLAFRDAEGLWLEVEDVRIDWSPRALFRGRIAVETIAAERVALLRPPAASGEEEAQDDAPLRLPELPSSLPPVTVERLAVEELYLGPPVLGQAATFALAGRLATIEGGEAAHLDLDLKRTDQATAQASIDATLRLDPASLQLAASVRETGGLIAAATGQARAGPLVLDLTGNGPLERWQGELTARVEGLGRARAAIALAMQQEPRLVVDGEVVPVPGVLPPELAPLAGDELTFALDLVQTGSQRLRIHDLRAGSGAVALAAEGEVDFEADRVAATATLKLERLAALAPLAGTDLAGALDVRAQAEGSLRQPQGELSLQIDELALADVRAGQLTARFDWAVLAPSGESLAGSLAGEGRVSDLIVAGTPWPGPRALDWRFALSAPAEGSFEIAQAVIGDQNVALSLSGAIDRATLAGDLNVNLAVAALAPLTEPFGQRVEGRLGLSADVSLAMSGRRIDLDLRGAAEELAGLPPGAAELVGDRLGLSARASIAPDREVTVRDLVLDGAGARLAGEAGLALPQQQISGVLAATVPRLDVLAPVAGEEIAGRAEVQANLGGTLAEPTIRLDGSAERLTVAGREVRRIDVTLSAAGLEAPQGRVRIKASAGRTGATLAGAYRLQEQSLRLHDLRLAAPGTVISGALTADLERTLLNGELTGQADLARLQPLLPAGTQGRLDLRARFTPEGGQQRAALTLGAQDLQSAFGSAARLNLQASVGNALQSPRFEATASGSGLRRDDVQVARFNLRANGRPEEFALSAELAGQARESFRLGAAANITRGDALVVALRELSGDVAGQPLQLLEPARIELRGEQIALAPVRLRAAGGRLDVQAALAPASSSIRANLSAFPLAVLASFGAPNLTGSVNAALEISGPSEAPQGTLSLDIANLRTADEALNEMPPLDVTLTARLAQNRLVADLRASGVTDQPASARLNAPVILKLQPFAFELPQDGRIEGALDAELRLARIADILALDDQRLAGRLAARLQVGGTIAAPQLDGTLSVADGRYENGATGTVLRNLRGTARVNADAIRLVELTGTDGGQGRIKAEGSLRLEPERNFPLDLRIELDDATLVRRDDLQAMLGGQLQLQGTTERARLSGRVVVDRVEMSIPEGGGPQVAVLEVEEVGGSAPPPEERRAGNGAEFDLRLDLQVEVPGRVFVRGRGLESEWQGNLRVTGTAASPRIEGTLNVRRGFFDFIDRRFQLRRGEIQLTGTNPPEPLLDVEAVAEHDDFTAVVRLEGPARRPQLTLSSEPELPQDEVLARLLFNRQLSAIGPAQALQLAAALNRLRGGDGFDPVGRVRNLLGVDTLDVEAGLDESTVRAGRYLGDDVYLEVETGTAERSSRARVEVEIAPNVSLEADTSQDARTGVGIKWKFDY